MRDWGRDGEGGGAVSVNSCIVFYTLYLILNIKICLLYS